ncbi:Rha family transcriptional regulator [Acetobacter sp.]|jgi:phage regulator Rha-like protein|uniref:Rha family transcriptional regulator n=1 Tax=Acetobacter sp. TaxID=440 RepID=UPI0025BE5147|nr:Rha family transcriptional regulator [Acetobacter sp.]MCH4090727.1 Rha family transcriptional regulator [Acetobacter sp.]MCI1300557.1 Rha family transcriptional regulator [Acetobacter sp.]MCI1316241.1 Rha family transcriptional regulator [Acetobacter sp.]
MNTLTTPIATMSSREIAELTGKRHDHVIRDIEKMLDDVKIDHPKFGGVYVDVKGEERKCYNLPKNLTLNLIAGYRADVRLKIIDRWMELEAAPAMPAIAVSILRLNTETRKERRAPGDDRRKFPIFWRDCAADCALPPI